MKYVYVVELQPNAKHHGLKVCVGWAEFYFAKVPSAKALLSTMRRSRAESGRDRKRLGLRERSKKEKAVFDWACAGLVRKYGVPAPPWGRGDEFERVNGEACAVSDCHPEGTIRLGRLRVHEG
jgi:hypothetical protein